MIHILNAKGPCPHQGRTEVSHHSSTQTKVSAAESPQLRSLISSQSEEALGETQAFVAQRMGTLAPPHVQGHLENPRNYSGIPNILALSFGLVESPMYLTHKGRCAHTHGGIRLLLLPIARHSFLAPAPRSY